MLTTLDQILATTRAGLPALQARRRDLERRAGTAVSRPAFLSGWDRRRLALVAEVKRRSPSAGTISAGLDPVAHARTYAAAGASAISVLTDGPYFGGSLADLEQVAGAVPVPLIRKDFILDELQILEARAAGASAVLLIVRALPLPRLRELLAFARDLGLEALVEAHDARELALALETDARYLGVNSRNLDTFVVDVDAAWALLAAIPPDRVAIAESGMASEADVRKAAAAGADGVLIGTALSGAADPSGLVRTVSSLPRTGR
ncbi:MAG: indole-3-glycerol phosphate synthase TrpC [Gemmatimonadota bacterium]|nr:indole-3-glycerol phosphate synthase TrpC [Gemmatimonadota bacterium]